MNKTRTVLLVCVILLSALTLSACMSRTNTEILIDTDTLQATREGARITIKDLLTNESYYFRICRKSSSERITEPIRITSTEHLTIELYPKKIKVTDLTNKEIYTICINILRVKVNSTGQFEEIKDREVTR